MADSAAEKATQRIPFGKRGIKDGNGRVIRTDHFNMSDVINDIFDGGPTRQEVLDMRIKKAVDGVASIEEMNRNAMAIESLVKLRT